MKDASTFDARQRFIRLSLNIWGKSVRPYGAVRGWITAGANRHGPASRIISSLEHLDKVHASPGLRVSSPRRHGTPRFLRPANRQHNPSVGLVPRDEVPVGQTILSLPSPDAPHLIRLTFVPIRFRWVALAGEVWRACSLTFFFGGVTGCGKMSPHRKLDRGQGFLRCFGRRQKRLSGGSESPFHALSSGFQGTPPWSYRLVQQIAPTHRAKAGRERIVWLRVIGEKSQAHLFNPDPTADVKRCE
jgi:hypothetical protein